MAPSVDLAAPSDRAIETSQRSARAIGAGALVSLVLHGVVFGALVMRRGNETGAAPDLSEAISVSLVPSEVLESRELSETAATTAASTTAAVLPAASAYEPQPTDLTEADAPAAPPEVDRTDLKPLPMPAPESGRQPETMAQPPETIEPAALDPAPAQASELSHDPSDQPEVEAVPREALAATREPPRTTSADKAPDLPPPARRVVRPQPTTAGASARSRSNGPSERAAPSASRGTILSYAASVRARVASHKPGGLATRGTAVVAFAITPSGGLAFARLATSSGSGQLDGAALSAVRAAAPFPAPPAGARTAELTFSIPFHFQ